MWNTASFYVTQNTIPDSYFSARGSDPILWVSWWGSLDFCCFQGWTKSETLLLLFKRMPKSCFLLFLGVNDILLYLILKMNHIFLLCTKLWKAFLLSSRMNETNYILFPMVPITDKTPTGNVLHLSTPKELRYTFWLKSYAGGHHYGSHNESTNTNITEAFSSHLKLFVYNEQRQLFFNIPRNLTY